jgi:dephospho-CoA kinase
MKDCKGVASPFIIGLTGAIGTGKSLVRKMLEHKGALTIDADRLAHGAYVKGSIGYRAMLDRFGRQILDKTENIDRKKLGILVFDDPLAFKDLEALIHPLVTQAVNRAIDLSPLPIIIIEAIKLLESGLKERCDCIWSVTAPLDAIYRRLGETRGMDRAQVEERLSQQSIRNISADKVDLNIVNQGGVPALWTEVSSQWEDFANQSRSFSTAVKKTNALMAPFARFLVQPSNESVVKVIESIETGGLDLFPGGRTRRSYLAAGSLVNLSIDPKTAIYYHFFWEFGNKQGRSYLLLSTMDHFNASVSGISKNFSKNFS